MKPKDPTPWSSIGCIPILGTFLAIIGIAAAVVYALSDYTNGLLLIIAILLAAILFVLATRPAN
jgi:hypothetical protein